MSGRNDDVVTSLRASLRDSPRVLKSHSPANVESFFGDREAAEIIQPLLESGKIVYVYRDGRDVMTSLYFYVRKVKPELSSIPFGRFLRMKDPLNVRPIGSSTNVEYWRDHVSGWLDQPHILPISFESLVLEFDREIHRLSEFLGQPMPRSVANVVRSPRAGSMPRSVWARGTEKLFKLYKRLTTGVDLTSVDFRMGRIGSFEEVFTADDLEYFQHVAGEVMVRLGYDVDRARRR